MEAKEEIDKTITMHLTKVNTNGFRNNIDLVNEVLSKKFRFRLCRIDLETDEGEWLVTDLTEKQASIADLKQLYHDRWDIETAYRDCKKNMKMEEFSERKERLILQDIYACAWVFNMIQFIMMEKESSVQQSGKYKRKLNRNVAIGSMKRNLIKALMHPSTIVRAKSIDALEEEIEKYTIPIRSNRSYSREHKAKNHSKMSYRSNY